MMASGMETTGQVHAANRMSDTPGARQSIPRALCAIAALLMTASPSVSRANDWPCFRGPSVTGASGETGVFDGNDVTLKVAWKSPLGSGYSGVAVAADHVVTMYSDEGKDWLAAYQRADGKRTWRIDMGPTYEGHDGSHTGPISTPLLDGGKAFALGPRGRLIAADLETGKTLWTVELIEKHDAVKPHYGFSTSPMMFDGRLIVEIGAPGGAVAAFNPADGELLWKSGEDRVSYQSPMPYTLEGKRHVLAACDKQLFGLDGATGDVIWHYAHEGDGGRGAGSMTPVPAGDHLLFLSNSDENSSMVRLASEGDGFKVDRTWQERTIRNSYNVPVFHDGHIYAYSSRFLTCVDTENGKARWRSREPGDGFLILVDRHLVIGTKEGGLHVVKADPEGFEAVAGIPVFDDLSWAHPSYADGSIFIRSLGELARVDIVRGAAHEQLAAATAGVIPGSILAKAEERIVASPDPSAEAAAFVADIKSFPLIEAPDTVHFVYHGDADDVAVAGDMFGARQERKMRRVPGTDLFYYSMKIEPDARVNYLFLRDYKEEADPRNPRQVTTTVYMRDMEMSFGRGEALLMSWFNMPRWREPDYFADVADQRRGDIRELKFQSEKTGGEVAFKVYHPAGYDAATDRYPVIYMHGAEEAVTEGDLVKALDGLIGRRVAPLLAVLVPRGRGPGHAEMFVEELIPFVDKTLRTVPEASSRASYGAGFAGLNAIVDAFRHREIFGHAACQSTFMFGGMMDQAKQAVSNAADNPPNLYYEWGKYDLRNPHEAWDLADANRQFAAFLEEQGVKYNGGEIHDGTGWSSWRNRFDQVFASLFPYESANRETAPHETAG